MLGNFFFNEILLYKAGMTTNFGFIKKIDLLGNIWTLFSNPGKNYQNLKIPKILKNPKGKAEKGMQTMRMVENGDSTDFFVQTEFLNFEN